MPIGPPDIDEFLMTPHDVPMDFVLACLTPTENEELRAMCHIAGVRLRAIGSRRHSLGVDSFAVVGPKGTRIVKLQECQPWTAEVFRGLIRHGLEQIS